MIGRRALPPFAAALVVTLGAGCATTAQDTRVVVPEGHDQLYVAVFVDETKRGEVGLLLTEAVQIEIWRRDPSALAQTFDGSVVAIDGTVVSLEEVPTGDGEIEVRMRTKAFLVDKNGQRVLEIALAEARARYPVKGARRDTELERQRALGQAARDMARHIVRQIDEAGRAKGERLASDA